MWFKTTLEWFGYVIGHFWAQNSDFGVFSHVDVAKKQSRFWTFSS